MLRLTVLVLFLANGLYLAWSQGWLRAYGFGPAQQTESHRLGQQIKPDAIRLLSAEDEKRLQEKARAEQAAAAL